MNNSAKSIELPGLQFDKLKGTSKVLISETNVGNSSIEQAINYNNQDNSVDQLGNDGLAEANFQGSARSEPSVAYQKQGAFVVQPPIDVHQTDQGQLSYPNSFNTVNQQQQQGKVSSQPIHNANKRSQFAGWHANSYQQNNQGAYANRHLQQNTMQHQPLQYGQFLPQHPMPQQIHHQQQPQWQAQAQPWPRNPQRDAVQSLQVNGGAMPLPGPVYAPGNQFTQPPLRNQFLQNHNLPTQRPLKGMSSGLHGAFRHQKPVGGGIPLDQDQIMLPARSPKPNQQGSFRLH